MALYTEISDDDFARMQQMWRDNARQKNLDDYEKRKKSIDSKYKTGETGLAGLLSNLTKDAKAVGDTLATTGAAIASPFNDMFHNSVQESNLATGKSERDKIAQKYGYKDWDTVKESGEGPDEMWAELQGSAQKQYNKVKKDAENYQNNAVTKQIRDTKQSKYLADAMRTEGVLLNLMGGGATPIGGAVSGALSGAADAVEAADGTIFDLQSDLSGGKIKSSKNADVDMGQLAKGATIGAITGAASSGIGGKIGNANSVLGSRLLNNKIVTSPLGRGAIVGGISGGIGGGLGAALEGGDVLGGAIQGAGSGALTGAATSGISSAARKVGTKATDALGVTDKINSARQKLMYTPGERQPKVAEETTVAKENANDEFMAYGDSGLANSTKRGRLSNSLRRFGNTLEGTQSNVTRAAARDLGIESTGKVIDNVRKKTGIRNLETQAQLAKELTGGQDSLMDKVQKQSLSASQDGKPFKVDTTKVISEIDRIIESNSTTNDFGTESARRKWAQNIKNDISNGATDVLTKANKMKAAAAELRGKGIVSPSEGDSAKAKIYTEIANKLDDLSYSAIPKENVNDMFDVTIGEMRSRANQAAANGNKQIATAYNTLANQLDKQPRTIQAYRSFKKDFVDVSKIDQLTSRAENGAAQNLGNSAAGILKKTTNMLLQRPVNAGLSAVGAGANVLADKVDGASGKASNTVLSPTPVQQITPDVQNMYNILGMKIGQNEGINAANTAAKNREYDNAEQALNQANAKSEALYQSSLPQGTNTMGGYGSMAQSNPLLDQMNQISNAMSAAMAAGDVTAYNQLADLYKTAYNTYAMQEKMTGGSTGSTANMSTQEKNQIAKLESAGTALDQLESLFKKAGGGQGIIGGNLANFLGGLGINSDVSTYNQLAQGLINQIGAAIGKTDALNTEGEVQRALSLVPKLTDTNETAQNKLATLRALLQENKGTYNQLYGA